MWPILQNFVVLLLFWSCGLTSFQPKVKLAANKVTANKANANKATANNNMQYICNDPINLKFTEIAELT